MMKSLILVTLSVVVVAATILVAADPQAELFNKVQSEDPTIVKFKNGILMKVLRKGTGEGSPNEGTPCSCHYEGKLPDGKVFDSSYARNEPIDFSPSQVIECWKIAMQAMNEGSKVKLWCPWNLAYGAAGMPQAGIPGKSPLIFEMEILKMKAKGKSASEGAAFFEKQTGTSWDSVQ